MNAGGAATAEVTPLAYFTVILCLALTTVNLLLTLGVIRRLTKMSSALPSVMVPAMALGSSLSQRAVEQLGSPAMEGGGLVAFMADDCEGCHAQAEDLAVFLSDNPVLHSVLVVTTKMHSDSAPRPVPLPADARVVTVEEPLSGPWQTDFQVSDFPTFFIVRDGRVAAAGHHISRLPSAIGRAPKR